VIITKGERYREKEKRASLKKGKSRVENFPDQKSMKWGRE
jgi:hypothetical protein